MSLDLMAALKASLAKHYGHSLYRPSMTACGKEKADVVVTYFPEQVTCGVCIDELNLQDPEWVTR